MFGKGYLLCALLTLFTIFLKIECEETLDELRSELKETKEILKNTEEKFTTIIDSLKRDINSVKNDHHTSTPLCKFRL